MNLDIVDANTADNGVCDPALLPNVVLEKAKPSTDCVTKWQGWSGHVKDMDPTVIRKLVESSSIFLFYGMDCLFDGRYMSASNWATLDLPSTQLYYLLDSTHVESDVAGKPGAGRLDSPMQQAGIFSLLGGNAVILNRMTSTLERNKQLFMRFARTSWYLEFL